MWDGTGKMRSFQECLAEGACFKTPPVPSSSDPKITYDISGRFGQGTLKCTCPGFRFRGTCKHIKVWKEECGWNEIDADEKQTADQKRDHICPRCGSKTMDVG